MKWEGRRQSSNIIDSRGAKTFGALGGGGIIIAILYALFTGDPSVILDSAQQDPSSPTRTQPDLGSDREKEFVSVVLADTEDVWKGLFSQQGQTYQEPKLVLFSGRVDSACGLASSAVGPFYCPRNQQVYLDLSFFRQLSEGLGARGDFAQAYVVAHEVGHHVQNILGLMDPAKRAQSGNAESVQIELQADCLAGVWAKVTDQQKQVLEEGDINEALTAAAAVGDDRLQERSQGYVVPDSFTHGTAEQRANAFSQGYAGGRLESCDRASSAIGSR